MTEKNNQAAEIVEKDLVAAASDTESVNDIESAEGRMLITEQEDAKGESAPTSTAADGRDEKTPIIFLDDVHVIFKTRTELDFAPEQGARGERPYPEAHARRDHRYRR